MTAEQRAAAEELCAVGRTLAARGLTPGTSGNLSVRVGTGFLMSPTNAALAELTPDDLALLDARGVRTGGGAPTKEAPLHLAVYAQRPEAAAIVHVHSSCAVALACLQHADPADVLRPLTPYAVMRIGRLPLVPYAKPGSRALADAVGAYAGASPALLLANHGPLFAAATLPLAAAGIEEIEEAAKVQLLLHGRAVRLLNADQIAELRGGA